MRKEIKIQKQLVKFEVEILNETISDRIDFKVDEIIEWSSDGTPGQTDPYLIGCIMQDGRIELDFHLSIFGRRELDEHILLLNEIYQLASKTIPNFNDNL